MIREALLSECGQYRHTLLRMWDDTLPVLVVAMLNPSKADHEIDDPTILTLIARAKLWGFGGILVVNLLGLRTSHPSDLLKHEDPTGPDNPEWVAQAVEYAANTVGWMLVAWGNGGEIVLPGSHWSEAEIFLDRFGEEIEFRCLGLTQSRAPKHPLARGKHRIPMDFEPIPYKPY